MSEIKNPEQQMDKPSVENSPEKLREAEASRTKLEDRLDSNRNIENTTRTENPEKKPSDGDRVEPPAESKEKLRENKLDNMNSEGKANDHEITKNESSGEKYGTDGLSKKDVDRINAEAGKIGTRNTWNEFKADQKNQEKYTSLNEAKNGYERVVKAESPWPDGEKPERKVLPPGTRFEMAMAPGQPDDRPGGFGTLSHIDSKEFVRENLAVKKDWKPEIDRVNTYETIKPLPVNEGKVGPQVDVPADRYLPGGEGQIEMRVPPNQRMDYLRLVDSREVK